MASGKAAKLRIGAGIDKARDGSLGGMPTGAPLMMDDDDEYVNNARAAEMAMPSSMAAAMVRATSFSDDSIVGG
jgi:hypothetical protein